MCNTDIFKNSLRIAADATLNSTVDGPGIRYVIWTQGCPHHCFQCHNPMTHSSNGGYWKKMDEILEEIVSLEYHSGITLSGGEPFEQVDKLLYLLDHLPEHLSVWCYTGYTFEQLMKDERKKKMLEKIDVLVDGRFDVRKKTRKRFKGSDNQRIIDVKKSLEDKRIVLWEA